MSLDALTETIGDIRARLGRGEFGDEAKVSQGIVMRVLQDLGWPVFDTGVVVREYTIQGRRVDYALVGKFRKPAVLLEVKRVGKIEVGEQQLFEYAFHGGAPIVVLTDGRNWWFYFTLGQGDYRDRRFAEVDLQGGDPSRNADRLLRYLEREAVLDGEARKRAEADLEGRWRQRTAEEALPSVWNRILSETDGPLIQLVRERVEADCGVSPSADSVRRFLGGVPVHGRHDSPPPPPPPLPPPNRKRSPTPPGRPSPGEKITQTGLIVRAIRGLRSARDPFVSLGDIYERVEREARAAGMAGVWEMGTLRNSIRGNINNNVVGGPRGDGFFIRHASRKGCYALSDKGERVR